jgi:hypothetical protein
VNGTSADLAGLAVLAAAALGGALAGALRQVVHVAAVGLAALLAGPLGGALERSVAGLLGEGQAPLAGPLARLAAFVGVFLAAGLVAQVVLAALRRGSPASPANRAAGALLGGAQAALALWALCSLLVLWGGPVGPPAFRLDPSQGDLLGFARDHNLLEAVAPREAALLRGRLGALREAAGKGSEEGEGPVDRARRTVEEAGAAARRAEEALEKAAREAR